LFERGEEISVLPIGGTDLSAFKVSEDFTKWLTESIERGIKNHSRKDKGIKLWHIQGLSESFQEHPCSLTFHETDRLTDVEVNILKQQKTVFVTSNYTKEVFEKHGLKNVVYCPLGFDDFHFHKTNKRYLGKNVKTFGLYGKLESRKNTIRVLSAWIKKFGNKDGYALNCAISNSFIPEPQFKALIASTFPNGEQPFNVNFINFQKTLEEYNDVLNAADVDLTGLSSCEGFNLPTFQSLCLGKWSVCLDAHVHKDFANKSNAILVNPTGTRPAEDGIFFRQGYFVNQGEWADFTDEDLDTAFDRAVEVAKTPNPNGEALAKEFTWDRTVDTILENL
jgi:glycosyltransferase involved in cell wall biosynthesis